MNIKSSLRLKLFITFSFFLAGFVCILTLLQVFVIGRMYTTSEYVQQRERELSNKIPDFLSEIYYMKGIPGYDINRIEDFEASNNVNMLVLDKNMGLKYITKSTQGVIKQSYINYIRKKAVKEAQKVGLGSSKSFRIYNGFNLPTKYIASVYTVPYGAGDRDYLIMIIPEVITGSTLNIYKGYISYVVIFLIIITFALSGFFSYMVTKPILEINKSASKMAEMDFTTKCRVERSDEIGNLAKTLNYLSNSLEGTLKKLYTANSKLQADLNLQKELDNMRTYFIAAITHEFKTPITLIRGYTESIKDNVADGEEKEFALDTVIKETEKMDKLVNELLDLSKLESMDYKLNISEFSINNLIDNISKKYEKVMESRGIRYETQLIENWIVEGDPFRIEQVVTNFLNNAVENTSKGNTIKLSLKDYTGSVEVSVYNEGRHIEDDEIKRIWDKFYRVEKSRNKKYGGTGLGLAISSAILNLHSSSFGAENIEGGVRFYFTLRKVL